MTELHEFMPVAGMENVLTVLYGNGVEMEIVAGPPLDQDGRKIFPVDRCVSVRIARDNETVAALYLNYEMAFDLMRGLWLAVWKLSTWRERVKLLMSYRW